MICYEFGQLKINNIKPHKFYIDVIPKMQKEDKRGQPQINIVCHITR